MAFRDAMNIHPVPCPCPGRTGCRRKRNKERHSSTRGNSQLGPSPPPLEGCGISDISMAKEEGPQQHDSDVIVEEEREESMETDTPLDSTAPHPSGGKGHPRRPQGQGQ